MLGGEDMVVRMTMSASKLRLGERRRRRKRGSMVDDLRGWFGEGSKVSLESEDNMEGHRVVVVEGSIG
jgi:hypothetical protein